MAFALIANAGAKDTTSAINTTGANLIVLAEAFDSGAGVSDSKSNTWTGLTTSGPAQSGTAVYCRLWYCFNPTVGSGHTFSVALSYGGIFAAAFSGAVTSPFDQENGAIDTGDVTTLSTGSITPGQNNELVIAGICFGGSTPTSGSSFTVTDSLNNIGGTQYGGGMAYKIQTTLAAVNHQWNWTTAAKAAVRIASFKAAASSSKLLLQLQNQGTAYT